MNALSWEQKNSTLGSIGSIAEQTTSLAAADIRARLRPLLAILTSFWVYVTVSNVLYAHSMQASIATMSDFHFFAPWDARVLQHVFVFPVFLGCVFASLRIGWLPLWRALPLQLLVGIAFAAMPSPLLVGAELLLGTDDMKDHHSSSDWLGWLDTSQVSIWVASATSFLLTYGFGLALATGFTLYRRIRDSQVRFAAMEQAWSAARLSALRMQLSPHTLFNLLNTIRGQIAWDPATAQSMVVQLADLLRQLLNAGECDTSRLQDEMKFVQLYLELQQKRFADRLTVTVPNLDTLPPVWVPSLILQPLIENAVVHGLSGHQGPVEVSVESAVVGNELVLRVTNTCVGQDRVEHQGIGLRNVAERLAVQFGERATFTAGPDASSRWVAEIHMPLLHDGPPQRRTQH